MRRQTQDINSEKLAVLPEYGRQKLLGYAESFRDLAQFFEEEYEEDSEKHKDFSGEMNEDEGDRFSYLWQKKVCESRELMADHLKEVADIMSGVAGETYRYRPLSERRYRQIARLLKESGILLKEFLLLENEDNHMELCLTMKSRSQDNIVIEDVAALLSVAMHMRLRSSGNSCIFMTGEWRTFHFREEPVYHVLTGAAKAVRETEKVSGDNYSFCETGEGRMVAILSDGVGSGERACEESEKVIEMTERLLEAGFRKEAAIQIINGVLAAGGHEQKMSTLDLCDIDLYTGTCELLKVGAASTYIKREYLVDRLYGGTLPLGVFGQIEPEVISRQLQDGDYIIMLSDGVTEAFAQGMGEDMLPELIGQTVHVNPGEIANQILGYCLKQSRGKIRDDMTVLVIGIWKQVRE